MKEKAHKKDADTGKGDLYAVFRSLGQRNDSVKRTIARLQTETGKAYSYSAVSAVINGRRFTQRIAAAFLEVAGEMKQELAGIRAKAQEMASTSTSA